MNRDNIILPRSVVEQALDAFAFAYNACESDWVMDEKIDPAMKLIQAALEQPQGEHESSYLDGGSRYKVTHLKTSGYCIIGLPANLLGKWVALVDATDNKHMDSQQPQSVTDCHQSQPQVEQEPVAWMTEDGRVATDDLKRSAMASSSKASFNIPLYTHPQPKRGPLTDEQIDAVYGDTVGYSYIEFARAIERAHGIGGEA